MLTQTQAAAVKHEYAGFIDQCRQYHALLASHNLPYSVDLEHLKGILRGRIADQLLQADPSLKLRNDLLATPQGKQRLRAEVISTVDLDGYQDVASIEQALAGLRHTFGLVLHLPDQYQVSFQLLAGGYKLDLVRLLDERTMNWEGKEHVLAYVTELGQELQRAQRLLKRLGMLSGPTRDGLFTSIARLYRPSLNGPHFEPDEHLVYTQLLRAVEERGLLDGFPANCQA